MDSIPLPLEAPIEQQPEQQKQPPPPLPHSQEQDTPTTTTSATTTPNTINPIKRFKASSLSVNKKFLSQSASNDPKLNKNIHASPRLSSLSSSSSSTIQSSAPRLLTGKIGLNHAILNPSGSGASGWAKTPLVVAPSPLLSNKSSQLTNPTLQTNDPFKSQDDSNHHTGLNGFLQALSSTHPPTPSSTPPTTLPNNNSNPIPSSSTTSAIPATTPAAPGGTNAAQSSSSSSSPWVKLASSTRPGLDNLTTDFPTAQEVAQHTKLKAQSMAAAVAARDKAVQDRAAASAAYNQQLLQTLDGFRGTHLDPNASHWDEMEDEDDMFGEVVEFGDGTQYKVTEVKPPATDPPPSTSNGPTSPATLSQNLAKKLPTPRDTDQMPPFLRARAELKSLFNERIGKFEPYSGKIADKTKENQLPHVQILQRQREGSGDLSTSPSASSARLPDSTAKDGGSSTTDTNVSRPDRASLVSPPDSSNLLPRTNLSQPKRQLTGPLPEPDNQAPGPSSSDDPAKYKKPDLDQLHRAEMTSAAERARKRRQEEEATREAEKERAKLKAAEIEAKLKAAADAAAKKSKPSDTTTQRTKPKDNDSWRSRAPPRPSEEKPAAQTSSPKIPKAVVAQPPTDSLAKKAVVVNSSESSTSRPETKPATRPSSHSNTATPLPSQDAAFRNRTDAGTSSRPPVWKSKTIPSSVSQSRLEHRPQPANPKQLPDTTAKHQGESKPLSRPDGRQPAPHLIQELVKAPVEPTPRKESAPSPRPQAPPALKTVTDVWPFKPTPPVPTQASPVLPGSTNRPASTEKHAGFKLPEMSHLDTVMSRIKVVLEADKEARSKAIAANQSSDSKSNSPPPTKLKTDSTASAVKQGSDEKPKEIGDNPAGTSTSSSTAVYVAGRPRTLLPRKVPDPPKPPVPSPKNQELSKPISPTLGTVDTSSSELPKIPSTLTSYLAPSNPASKKPTTVRKAARFDIPPSPAPRPAPPTSVNPPLQQTLPKWVHRDPIVFFDATRQERPSSPVPAWKAFTVKFGTVKPKPRIASHLIKSFWNPLVPAKVNVLTWDPPMANLSPKTLSRDDLLFRKKYIQGIVVSHVQFPKDSIASLDSKLQSIPLGEPLPHPPPQPKSAFENKPTKPKGRSGAAQVEPKNRAPGRADETTSWRRPVEEKATVSTVAPSTSMPSASSPIDASKESSGQSPVAEGSKANDSNATRQSKSKIPDGCKVAFQKPAHLLTSSNPPTTGMFMVNSEITGEEIQSPSRPKQSTTHGGSMQTSSPMTPRSRNSPPPVALTPRSTSITGMGASKGSTSSWTKSPLAFSVLDSHTKNVWSQPDGQMTAKRAPSGKTENSLEGITDDFPATLPRTLNDFNAEEEPRDRNQQHSSSISTIERSGGEQNAVSSTYPDLPSGTNIPDDQAKANGLVVQPVYMNSPTGPPHYNNEHPSSMNPAHIYPHHNYSSPPNFPVPPGYQLVPIGSMQTTQTSQYPPIPAIYPAQASAPWSPSLGPVQPNGYASSPQLYSPNTNYPLLGISSAAYPSHAHPVGPNQISDGFNRSPGPIAPRGGSRSSGPTGHMNRPSINEPNNFGPNMARNHGNFSPVTNKRNTMTAPGGPNYHLAGPATNPIVDGPPASELGPVGAGYGDGNFINSPFHPSSILPPNIHHAPPPPQQQQPTSFNLLHHGTAAGGQSPHMMNTGHVHWHHHQSSLVGPMPPPPPPQHQYLPPTTHGFHPTNTNPNPSLQQQHGLVGTNNGVNHGNQNRLVGEMGGHAPSHHAPPPHPNLGYSNSHQHQHTRVNSSSLPGGTGSSSRHNNNNGSNNNLNSGGMNNNGGYRALQQQPNHGNNHHNHNHNHHNHHRNLNNNPSASGSVPVNGIHLPPPTQTSSSSDPNNNNNNNIAVAGSHHLHVGINGLYNPRR